MNHVRALLIGCAAIAIATSAAAQQRAAASPLVTELWLTRIVVRDDGKEMQTPAALVQPGDTLQYTASYRNQSKATLNDVVASLPVPQGMQLVPAPAGEVQASLDGKTFARLPLMRRVQQGDGRWADVPVPLAEIRYVRWPARSLAAGEQFDANVRVRVSATGS
jgi:uncharacterized repeat protein (TIGR01451 family)